MSIIGVTILLVELSNILTQIYVDRDFGYILQNIFYTPDEMAAFDYVTLGSLNNSANFIFGLTGGDVSTGEVDIFNNPYVEVMGLAMTSGNGIELHHRYELTPCTEEHLLKFLNPWVLSWYA